MWPWNLTENNRAPLLSNIKLYVSFHHHMWIQTGVRVRKRLSWVATSVTLTLTFCMDVTLVRDDNSWKFHNYDDGNIVKKVWRTDRRTDGQTDRQTENTIHKAAWSQLKKIFHAWSLIPTGFRTYGSKLITEISRPWLCQLAFVHKPANINTSFHKQWLIDPVWPHGLLLSSNQRQRYWPWLPSNQTS